MIKIHELTEGEIKEIRVAGYEVSDENGGNRAGFDYIEHLREVEKANKVQNIEGV